MEKSSAIIKVPPLTVVYDVSGVATLNSVSSNPILFSTCRLHEQRRGAITAAPPGTKPALVSLFTGTGT
jgi:hypothetical protein